VTCPGTVTAASEAAIWGLPAIALSPDSPKNPLARSDFEAASQVARRITRAVIQNGLPEGNLLNVNIPFLPLEQIKGYRLTRMGLRVYHDKLDSRVDPRGRPYYWISGDSPTGIPERGSDIGAVADGFVSITPLKLDLTAYSLFPELNQWEWDQTEG